MTAIEFKNRFPEFVNTSDVTIDIYIQDAGIMVTEQKWGQLFNVGVAFLSAHYLTLALKGNSGKSGAVNQVASKSVEGVSVSYTTPQGTTFEDYFLSTIYGQRYLSLLSQVGLGNVLSV